MDPEQHSQGSGTEYGHQSPSEGKTELVTINWDECMLNQKHPGGQVWWCAPLNPALRRQSQVDLCESKASLVYVVGFRPSGATGRPQLKKTHESWEIAQSVSTCHVSMREFNPSTQAEKLRIAVLAGNSSAGDKDT